MIDHEHTTTATEADNSTPPLAVQKGTLRAPWPLFPDLPEASRRELGDRIAKLSGERTPARAAATALLVAGACTYGVGRGAVDLKLYEEGDHCDCDDQDWRGIPDWVDRHETVLLIARADGRSGIRIYCTVDGVTVDRVAALIPDAMQTLEQDPC